MHVSAMECELIWAVGGFWWLLGQVRWPHRRHRHRRKSLGDLESHDDEEPAREGAFSGGNAMSPTAIGGEHPGAHAEGGADTGANGDAHGFSDGAINGGSGVGLEHVPGAAIPTGRASEPRSPQSTRRCSGGSQSPRPPLSPVLRRRAQPRGAVLKGALPVCDWFDPTQQTGAAVPSSRVTHSEGHTTPDNSARVRHKRLSASAARTAPRLGRVTRDARHPDPLPIPRMRRQRSRSLDVRFSDYPLSVISPLLEKRQGLESKPGDQPTATVSRDAAVSSSALPTRGTVPDATPNTGRASDATTPAQPGVSLQTELHVDMSLCGNATRAFDDCVVSHEHFVEDPMATLQNPELRFRVIGHTTLLVTPPDDFTPGGLPVRYLTTAGAAPVLVSLALFPTQPPTAVPALPESFAHDEDGKRPEVLVDVGEPEQASGEGGSAPVLPTEASGDGAKPPVAVESIGTDNDNGLDEDATAAATGDATTAASGLEGDGGESAAPATSSGWFSWLRGRPTRNPEVAPRTGRLEPASPQSMPPPSPQLQHTAARDAVPSSSSVMSWRSTDSDTESTATFDR